jgi:hypothetical protein
MGLGQVFLDGEDQYSGEDSTPDQFDQEDAHHPGNITK